MTELPPAGGTSEPERIHVRQPDASGTLYSVDEAADRFGVSRATLQRRLAAGELVGAHKVPGPKGETWRIPAASLVGLGYQPVEAPAPAQPPPAAIDVRQVVTALQAALASQQEAFAAQQRQLEAGEDERRRQAEERAETERRAHAAEIEAARMGERVAALERELATARRRWWRRG